MHLQARGPHWPMVHAASGATSLPVKAVATGHFGASPRGEDLNGYGPKHVMEAVYRLVQKIV